MINYNRKLLFFAVYFDAVRAASIGRLSMSGQSLRSESFISLESALSELYRPSLEQIKLRRQGELEDKFSNLSAAYRFYLILVCSGSFLHISKLSMIEISVSPFASSSACFFIYNCS